MTFFQSILSSVMKGARGLNRFGSKSFGKLHDDINDAVDSLMSTTGEVSSLVYAEHLLNLIEQQDDDGLNKFTTIFAIVDFPLPLSPATTSSANF